MGNKMKTMEYLSRKEMARKYSNTWLGSTNVKYSNNDGVTLEFANIVYTDKSRDELAKLQVIEGEDIID